MFNLQGSEIVFILLLALVVLGPEKLPGAIKRFTQTYTELRKMGSGFQTELKSALDEPMKEMRETAGLIRENADPSKIVPGATSPLNAEREAERALGAPSPSDVADASDVGVTAGHPVPDVTAGDAGSVDEWADPVDVVEVPQVYEVDQQSDASGEACDDAGSAEERTA